MGWVYTPPLTTGSTCSLSTGEPRRPVVCKYTPDVEAAYAKRRSRLQIVVGCPTRRGVLKPPSGARGTVLNVVGHRD